jgi:hypothetical protein
MCQALNLFGITLRTTDKDIQIYVVEITIDLFSPYCWAKAALGKLLLLVPHVPYSDLTRQGKNQTHSDYTACLFWMVAIGSCSLGVLKVIDCPKVAFTLVL